MTLTLAGCSKSTTPSEPSVESESTQTPVESGPPGPVVVLMPLTGLDGTSGQSFVSGLKAAVRLLGAQVGLSEEHLIVRDIADDPQKGLAGALNVLETEKPSVLVGLPDGVAVTNLRPELEKRQVALLTPTTDELSLVTDQCVLRLTYPDSVAAKALSRFVRDNVNVRQIVIVADSDDLRSLAWAEAFGKVFTAAGGTVSTCFSFGEGVKADRLVQMMTMEKPDLVFAAITRQSAVTLIDRGRNLAFTPGYAGPEWYDPTGFTSGPGNFEGIITTGRGYADAGQSMVMAQWEQARQAEGITTPVDTAEVLGFDAGAVLVNALDGRVAGARDSAWLLNNLNATRNVQGVRGPLTVGTDRSLVSVVPMLRVKDHAFELAGSVATSIEGASQ